MTSPTAPGPSSTLTWREARQVADRVYDEFAFQSIYALKQGNALAGPDEVRRENAVKNARKRVSQSKLMVASFMAFVIFGGAAALRGEGILGVTIQPAIYDTSVIAGTYLLLFSLFWMTGLQVAPTFLGSRVFPVLRALPLTRRDLDRIATLVVWRMFDTPALACLILFPASVALGTDSVLAGLLILPGLIVIMILSGALSLQTGTFFFRRVAGSRSRGSGAVLLRWLYHILGAIPVVALTAVVGGALDILALLSSWEVANPTGFKVLMLTFPFPLAYPSGAAADPSGALGGGLFPEALVGVLALYGLLTVLTARWLWDAPLKFALATSDVDVAGGPMPATLSPVSPIRAVLQKDLRIASRSTGYAYLILLPLLDAAVIGLETYWGNPNPQTTEHYALAAVAVAAILATFFGPAFFATEVLGYSMTRTLPMTRRTLLLGKSSLILIIYVVASGLVMTLVAARLGDPLGFLGFAVAELPAVTAAAFLEMGVLFHQSAKTGIPLTNLYSGAWWATLVVLPGLLIAGLPLLLYYALTSLGQFYDTGVPLGGMALSSLLLLGTIGTWALWGGRRAI